MAQVKNGQSDNVGHVNFGKHDFHTFCNVSRNRDNDGGPRLELLSDWPLLFIIFIHLCFHVPKNGH